MLNLGVWKNPKKLERIIEARVKLKARFEEQMQATASVADEQPKGFGPSNRHNMPTIPMNSAGFTGEVFCCYSAFL